MMMRALILVCLFSLFAVVGSQSTQRNDEILDRDLEVGPFRYVEERAWERGEVKSLPATENAASSAAISDNCRNQSIEVFAGRFERYI